MGDFVRFVTSHFLFTPINATQPIRRCDSAMCALVHWTRQVQALASRISMHSGESTSVHIFSTCMNTALATLLSTTGAEARVKVHASHSKALMRAVSKMRAFAIDRHGCSGRPLTTRDTPGSDNCEWARPGVLMLLRWQIMNMADARLVVYLDLDVEVLPRWSLLLLPPHSSARRVVPSNRSTSDVRVDQAAKDWLSLLRCAEHSNQSLWSYPDHSSPVNGALLVVRPNVKIYLEGVAVLQGAIRWAPFNYSHGWERIGRPHSVVPPTDHVWQRRRGHSALVDGNTWDFVGGSVDQGFVYYMMRVRHTLGVDIRLSECAAAPQEPLTVFHHYGGVHPMRRCPSPSSVSSPTALQRVEPFPYGELRRTRAPEPSHPAFCFHWQLREATSLTTSSSVGRRTMQKAAAMHG